jgi:hypothetical protein
MYGSPRPHPGHCTPPSPFVEGEWQETGCLHAAHTPSALAKLEKHNETYRAVGKASLVLDRGETAQLTGRSRFFGAWFHPEGGHLNSRGYSRGLSRETPHRRDSLPRSGRKWRLAEWAAAGSGQISCR